MLLSKVLEKPKRSNASAIYERIFTKKNISKKFQSLYEKGHAVGIDGMHIKSVNDKNRREMINVIYKKSRDYSYKFAPYLEILKTKKRSNFPRVISIPTLRDQIFLSLLKDFLHELYSDEDNRRLPNNVIKSIKKTYFELSNDHYFIKIDIKSFYDNINKKYLLRIMQQRIRSSGINNILSSAIYNETLPRGQKRHMKDDGNDIGIPQGIPISNILSHIYMLDFDKKAKNLERNYWRYVDDILIFCRSNPAEIIQDIRLELQDLELSINEEKTFFGSINENFGYLGYEFCEHNIKYNRLVSINRHSVSKFIANRIKDIRRFDRIFLKKHKKGLKEEEIIRLKEAFIDDLNEKITGAFSEKHRYGWVMYFSQCTDTYLFHMIDKIIEENFKKSKVFYSVPSNIKKTIKAYYYTIGKRNMGYFFNYDEYSTSSKKRIYLENRGIIKEHDGYDDSEIDNIFYAVRRKNLDSLEEDVGILY